MANKADKWEQNVPGKFYVDQQCIDCDLCRETATGFFARSDEGGYTYVAKQPATDEETALCMEAKEGCPVEAIGDDGDS
jgi:ferredoxin